MRNIFAGIGKQVEPVKLSGALFKEANLRRVSISPEQILVPNVYTVTLAASDYQRLSPYEAALDGELAYLLEEDARKQKWHFSGKILVSLEQDAGLKAGSFKIFSQFVDNPSKVKNDILKDDEVNLDRLPARFRSYQLMVSSAGVEAVHPLTSKTLTLGRSGEVELYLADRTVSRLHGEITLQDGRVHYEDKGSANGSWVNGVKVADSYLRVGDVLELGATRIVLQLQGEPRR